MIRNILYKAKLNSDLSVGVLFLVIGICVYVLSFSEATGESDWSLSPGFFPRLIAGLIIALSVVHLIVTKGQKRKKTSADRPEDLRRSKHVVLITFAVIILYPYFMEYFGFFLSSFLSISILMRLYGIRQWLTIVLVSLGIPVGVYYLALKVMYIVFPTGIVIEKLL